MIGLAALAVAIGTLAAHASAAYSPLDDHESDTVTLCVAAAGTLAVIGVATFAFGRVPHRPLWTIPAPCTPVMPYVAASTGFLVRAGPPPAFLQVFRS